MKKKEVLWVIFFFQSRILGLFGLWGNGRKYTGKPSKHVEKKFFFFIFYILSATLMGIHNMTRAIEGLLAPNSGRTGGLIRALSFFPVISSTLRGPIILTIIASRSTKMGDLQSRLDSLFSATMTTFKSNTQRLILKWLLLNILFIILCNFFFFSTFSLRMLDNANRLQSLLDPVALFADLPFLRVPFWCLLLANVIFGCIPFSLTQMVQIALYISGLVLNHCCRNLNEKLQMVSDKITPSRLQLVPEGENEEKDFVGLKRCLEDLIEQRKAQYDFVECVNKHFGCVTLLSYVLDVIAAVGGIGVLIKSPNTSYLDFYILLLSSGMFTVFASLLYLPMVAASETVTFFLFTHFILLDKKQTLTSLPSLAPSTFPFLYFIKMSFVNSIFLARAEIFFHTISIYFVDTLTELVSLREV
jgi:energy-converting hydrogenase Eha subunit C